MILAAYCYGESGEHNFGGPEVLGWVAGFMQNGKTELHIFDGHTVIG